jgi:hypothetical protein
MQQQDLAAFMAHNYLALRQSSSSGSASNHAMSYSDLGVETGRCDTRSAAPAGMWSVRSTVTWGPARRGTPELRTAEALAGSRCGADGAVILQQQEAVRVGPPFGHVAFARAYLRQARQLFGQRGGVGQGGAVGDQRLLLPDMDQSIEGCLAQFGPHRVDQPEGQFRMGVREPCVAGFGQVPTLGRTANAAPLGFRCQKAIGRQPDHLLSRGLRGDAERGRNVADPLRPTPLDHAQ